MSNGITEIKQSLDAIRGQVDQMARELEAMRSGQLGGSAIQKASIAGYHLRPESIGGRKWSLAGDRGRRVGSWRACRIDR